MSEPKGFIDSTKPDFMYKLHKTLYGINLASRAWYNKLKSCLLHWDLSTLVLIHLCF